jgi:O-antigen/teichoic acid export membrane protein
MKRIGIIKTWLAKYKQNVLLNRLVTVLGIDMLVKVSGFLLLPVYLRLMTQEEYGLYNYLISIILTFSLVLNFGLYIPLTKLYHDRTGEKGKLLFTITLLLLCLLAIVLVPTYLLRWDYQLINFLFKSDVNYDSYRVAILVAIVASVFNFMLTNFFYASEKIMQIKRYSICRIVAINLFSLAALYFFSNNDHVEVRLASTYIVEFILFSFFAYFYIRELKYIVSKKLLITSLRLAYPIMLSALFGIIINFSDKFFLEKYGNDQHGSSFNELSYYYLAIACASILPAIFTSFQNAWLPLFLKEKDLRVNIEKTNKFTLRLAVIFCCLSICIFIFMLVIISTGIIEAKYQKALYVLPILLVSQIIAAIVPLYGNYFVYFGKTHVISISGGLISLVTVGLSFLLIPTYKVYGAAIVSVGSNLCYLITYYFIVRVHVRKNLTKQMNLL